MKQFIRTCQECGHKIVANDPKTLKGGITEAYRNRACPKCKSEAFDYGGWQEQETTE